jgi:hypothetical protein
MAEHFWQVQTQPESTGLILLDAQGDVVQTNLKGQECLALFAEARGGKSMTRLGRWPIQELVGVSATLGGERRHEIAFVGLSGQVFELVVQPVVFGYQINGWLLIVREVAQGEEKPPLGEPPVQSTVFHWPPASPLTSNLP